MIRQAFVVGVIYVVIYKAVYVVELSMQQWPQHTCRSASLPILLQWRVEP